MTSLLAPVRRPQAQTGELLQLLVRLRVAVSDTSSAKSDVIFYTFC